VKGERNSSGPRKKIIITEGVTKYFGAMAALKNVNFQVFAEEIFGIAGPNGAGKTTLFNIISKVLPLSSGKILFNEVYIQDLHPHEICHLGIARTFQIPNLFESLTVHKNALVGATFGQKNKIQNVEKIAEECLRFCGMWEKRNTFSEELCLYDRKALMMACALATKPKLLMLDEPVAGLSSIEQKNHMELIKKINMEGITILIIEHNMDVLMGLSDRVMILQHGEKICEGAPREVSENEKVINSYLGESQFQED